MVSIDPNVAVEELQKRVEKLEAEKLELVKVRMLCLLPVMI